jgi:beta-N-acetylhexosaminidase
MNAVRRAVAAGLVGSVALLGTVVPASWAAENATSSPDDAERGTVRVVPAADHDTEAAAHVAGMSTSEKAASVVMGHVPTTDAATLAEYMGRTGIGGFILMGANIPATEAQLRQLTAALTVDGSLPPVIAIDQEGGDVSRLPWDAFPSSITLKDRPAAETGDAFAARGALLQRVGIGVNFGIVADVTADPAMFIHRRALGTNATTSAERVEAAVGGEADSAMSTLKHFPGHGSAPGDSHVGIPSTMSSKAQWAAQDAVPFRAGIDAGAEFLMFGHLSYPAVDPAPATLSPEWHRIAREELGFAGVMITDDLGMLQASGIPGYQDPVANAVASLAAGNDMVLAIMFSTPDSAPRIIDGITAAVAAGTLPLERLNDAALRVTAARLALAAQGRGLVPCAECGPVD